MTQDDINRARDAIAARAVFGRDTRDGLKTEAAIEAHADYIKISIDPRSGWAAALDEVASLKQQVADQKDADALQEDLNGALDTIDRLTP